jgi:hypothetical protein
MQPSPLCSPPRSYSARRCLQVRCIEQFPKGAVRQVRDPRLFRRAKQPRQRLGHVLPLFVRQAALGSDFLLVQIDRVQPELRLVPTAATK